MAGGGLKNSILYAYDIFYKLFYKVITVINDLLCTGQKGCEGE